MDAVAKFEFMKIMIAVLMTALLVFASGDGRGWTTSSRKCNRWLRKGRCWFKSDF